MMQIGRRRFFGLMGAAPLAAKAAADEAIAKAAGLGPASQGVGMTDAGSAALAPRAPYISHEARIRKISSHIKLFGLPTHAENELRQHCYQVQALDPDIACKKSWSMSVKIMTQRERNFQAAVARMRDEPAKWEGRQAMYKLFGFDW